MHHKIYYLRDGARLLAGRCCTAGVRFDRVYATLQNMVVPEIAPGEECPSDPVTDPAHPLHPANLVGQHGQRHVSQRRVVVDGPAMLTLQVLAHNMAERTTALLCSAAPDAGANTASTTTCAYSTGRCTPESC